MADDQQHVGTQDIFTVSPATLPQANIDLICIRGLQLPRGVTASNLWGDQKEQPAYVDVELQLSEGIQSASSQDRLDKATVNYGVLSKLIRRETAEPRSVSVSIWDISRCIWQAAEDGEAGKSSLLSTRLTLRLPKASAYGEGFQISQSTRLSTEGTHVRNEQYVISLDRLRIMTLIGVNDVERTGKQALVVTCSIFSAEDNPAKAEDDITAFMGYERDLVAAIESTAFQTLEALAEHLYAKMTTDFRQFRVAGIRLRIEKPSAIIHAEAPAIELIRRFRQ